MAILAVFILAIYFFPESAGEEANNFFRKFKKGYARAEAEYQLRQQQKKAKGSK